MCVTDVYIQIIDLLATLIVNQHLDCFEYKAGDCLVRYKTVVSQKTCEKS